MKMTKHWDQIYATEPVQKLGWYEDKPEPCLRLLEKCGLSSEDPVLDVGAGASTFIDCLIDAGFQHIYAADISPIAIDRLKSRLGEQKARQVTWIVDDVTRPTRLDQLSDIALWHDRALLHFLTQEDQQQSYRKTLLKTVRAGGYAIIAVFSMQGAKQCSGLEVRNYDLNRLAELLGERFELKEWFDYLYTQPSGDVRPYIYTLFQRQK